MKHDFKHVISMHIIVNVYHIYLHLHSGYIFSLNMVFSLKGVRAENLPAV